MNEQVIIQSSDKTVKLTTQRIVFDNGERQQEILIEDYAGYSFRHENIGNYGVLVNIFGLLTFLLFLGVWNDNVPSITKIGRLFSFAIFFKSFYAIVFLISGFLFLVTIFYYLLGRRHYLEIRGKYNCIVIPLKRRRPKAISRFLKAIEMYHRQTTTIR